MSDWAVPKYQVFSIRAATSSGDSSLHLVREDAEASLCDIPTSALGDPMLDPVVCSDCTDWLHERRLVSGQRQQVEPG